MELAIGQWVRRVGEDEGKWHLVDSVISGAAITNCGRRMEALVDNRPLETSDVKPLTRMIGQPQLCQAGCPIG